MSKALQEQIDELFQATKDLKSLEEIKPHCDRFNEWINTHTNYKSIPLEQGKNAEAIAKHDENGNVKGQQLKHYAVLMCGLDRDD
jgi:hypothetical protein